MRTIFALTAAVLACALARPLVSTDDGPVKGHKQGIEDNPIPPRYLSQYILPRMLLPHYEGYDDNLSPIQIPDTPETDPLDVEIDVGDSSPIQEKEQSPYYYGYIPHWIPRTESGYISGILSDSNSKQANYHKSQEQIHQRNFDKSYLSNYKRKEPDNYIQIENTNSNSAQEIEADPKSFALSPLNKNYYNNNNLTIVPTQFVDIDNEAVIDQRKTRQNPNWSKQKSLVAENLDRLRTGLANKDYRLPVSLLPNNLRWLKINHDLEGSTHGDNASTDKPKHIHVLETPAANPAESIYGVALIAAVGSALAMALVGFLFGWYTLSKKAKAAADVDYPAYGVTGPTTEVSGDRKLAQSAHMYHYQHQKQQIIAMERNGSEHGNGSVSDPDSEEENEEGDYTVYECPGFATTGDMEVKNPLFNEETTPPTLPKNDGVKSQPRE